MAATDPEDELLFDAFDKTPSPPKNDHISMQAKLPPAPTGKLVVSKKHKKNDKVDRQLEDYLSKFGEQRKNIAIDYLQKALKREKRLEDAIRLAKIRFHNDNEKARKQGQVKASGNQRTRRKRAATKRKRATRRNRAATRRGKKKIQN